MMSSRGKSMNRIRKIRNYLQNSLNRSVDRLVISVKYGFGLFEGLNGRAKQREREMRERRRFHLLNRIHYEEQLAARGGPLKIYAKLAKKDRDLYKALYGEDSGEDKDQRLKNPSQTQEKR